MHTWTRRVGTARRGGSPVTTPPGLVTWVVVSAAPPATRIHEFLSLLHADPQLLVVVTTPTAATWIDENQVRTFTAWPVRHVQRSANEPRSYPSPNLVVALPLTFNTINKWAAGINDNVALGVLNEALGARIPIVASPFVKTSLAAHPAFSRSLEILTSAGVRLTATNAIKSAHAVGRYGWHAVLDLIREILD